MSCDHPFTERLRILNEGACPVCMHSDLADANTVKRFAWADFVRVRDERNALQAQLEEARRELEAFKARNLDAELRALELDSWKRNARMRDAFDQRDAATAMADRLAEALEHVKNYDTCDEDDTMHYSGCLRCTAHDALSEFEKWRAGR